MKAQDHVIAGIDRIYEALLQAVRLDYHNLERTARDCGIVQSLLLKAADSFGQAQITTWTEAGQEPIDRELPWE